MTVYGQIILKARALSHSTDDGGMHFLMKMFLDPWVISGLLSALAASAAWMMAIRIADLSLMYPVMALTFVIVPILAVLLFGERLSTVQVFGLVFIIVGVCLTGRTS